MYEVTVTDLDPRILAAVPHRGAYMAIGSAFERLAAWAGPRGLFTPATQSIGVYWDDPGTVPEADLRSAAGITVPEPVEDPEVETVRLAGGRHAVLRHVGPYAELDKAYDWLYRSWLPSSGEEPADAPPFEIYVNDPRTTAPADLVTEICLPLK